VETGRALRLGAGAFAEKGDKKMSICIKKNKNTLQIHWVITYFARDTSEEEPPVV
jgi:hypothetical protein